MKTTTYLLAGALVIASTGCTKEQKSTKDDPFFPDPKASSVNKFERSQTARGARSDGMIYAHHFDGDRLNSLGKQKLTLMLGDDTGEKTMKVYIVKIGEGATLDARKKAITEYLKDGLRPDEKLELVNGMNPDTWHPSAPTLARVSKTEVGEADTADPGPMMSGAGTISK
jgi:hypothetical protein